MNFYFSVFLEILSILKNFDKYSRHMQKRFFLSEEDIPRQWYNIQADMPVKPMLMLDPSTKEPVTVEGLSRLFRVECSKHR